MLFAKPRNSVRKQIFNINLGGNSIFPLDFKSNVFVFLYVTTHGDKKWIQIFSAKLVISQLFVLPKSSAKVTQHFQISIKKIFISHNYYIWSIPVHQDDCIDDMKQIFFLSSCMKFFYFQIYRAFHKLKCNQIAFGPYCVRTFNRLKIRGFYFV
eukprot:NODE_13_length_54415_cov_0.522424.p37 type:complete len:154 gc:universal NODE_13_length_54415_cov_0.522424:3259-2798(-)